MTNKKLKANTVKQNERKQRKTWSKEIRSNNVTQRMSVEELDRGGYLVILNKYGNGPKGEYYDITEKYYSEENPLEPDIKESVLDKAFAELVRK